MGAAIVQLLDRKYRPIAVVLASLGACAWMVVGAIGQFTKMVDDRALRVVESFSARPLAEHEEMKRRLTQNEKDIAALTEIVRQTTHNVDKLLGVYEDRRGIQLQLSSPARP